ncbi:MAG: oligosaccharide flippase family protein [Nitrososphaeria archaeon]
MIKGFLINIVILTSATILNGILGFFISVIVARTLEPSDFGTFSVMITIGAFLALVFDFGINPVLASRISVRKTTKLYDAVLRFRILLSVSFTILIIVFFILTSAMFNIRLDGQFLNWILVLCSVFWLLVISTEQSRVQGLKLFWVMAIMILAVNIVRFPLTLLVSVSHPNLDLYVVSYIIPPIILGFIIGCQRKDGWLKNGQFRLLKPLLPMIGWAGITVCLSAALMRVDLWIVSAIAGMAEAGRFAASFQAASLVFIIGSSLSSVILPEIARLDSNHQIREFLVSYLKKILPFFLIAVLLAFEFANFVWFFFGNKYKGIEMTTFFLTTSFILSTINSPFYLLYQSRRQYSFLAKVHFIQIVVLLLGCAIMVPHYGAMGAAMANLFMRILSISFFVFITLYKLSSSVIIPKGTKK